LRAETTPSSDMGSKHSKNSFPLADMSNNPAGVGAVGKRLAPGNNASVPPVYEVANNPSVPPVYDTVAHRRPNPVVNISAENDIKQSSTSEPNDCTLIDNDLYG